jgi:hypothetical protein
MLVPAEGSPNSLEAPDRSSVTPHLARFANVPVSYTFGTVRINYSKSEGRVVTLVHRGMESLGEPPLSSVRTIASFSATDYPYGHARDFSGGVDCRGIPNGPSPHGFDLAKV